jgi:hypothetical protein
MSPIMMDAFLAIVLKGLHTKP